MTRKIRTLGLVTFLHFSRISRKSLSQRLVCLVFKALKPISKEKTNQPILRPIGGRREYVNQVARNHLLLNLMVLLGLPW